MIDKQRKALAAVRFNSVETPDDVWRTSPSHVDGLHGRVEDRVRAAIAEARDSAGGSPVGLVLQGEKGVGKTHLLGSARRMVQREDGYFFLVELTTGKAFWDDLAEAMRSEFRRMNEDGDLQVTALVKRLCARAGVVDPLLSKSGLTAANLDELVQRLRGVDDRIAVDCADTIRALALYASDHFAVGLDYLEGMADGGDARRWGIRRTAHDPRALVRDISRVLSLTGPCIIAIDQLDTLVNLGADAAGEQVTSPELVREVALIADGMMQLRQTTRRTLSIVACLPNTWKMLESIASDTVRDRFTKTPFLGSIHNPQLGRTLVEKWLAVIYQREGFTPPHPTWPVAPSAFDGAWSAYTPRQLLKRIHAHAESCLYGEIRELSSFDEKVVEAPVVRAGPPPDYFQEYDNGFRRLRDRAAVTVAGLNQHNENDEMPGLLLAGLKAWVNEVGNDAMEWEVDVASSNALHAGLRRTVHEELDVKEFWSFRFVASSHGNRQLRCLRGAREAAQVRPGTTNRHLVLIQNSPEGWGGEKTKIELAEVQAAGGHQVIVSDDDLRTFSALKVMLADHTPQLLTWMAERKPVSTTTFLRHVLPQPGTSAASRRETRPPPVTTADQQQPVTETKPERPEAVASEAVPADEPVGRTAASEWPAASGVLTIDPAVGKTAEPASATETSDGEIVLDEFRIGLESLRKHVMIFAGSGSGKTVLLRRIVEECALRGVSAIVLDPNNDLARMGDAWPEAPAGWGPGDADSAKEYLANTEVVVWTPGRKGGRPLSFQPLPDFEGVRDDPDEFTASVEAAVARLVPHAGLTGASKAAVRGRAVLREALTYYARRGKRDLAGFVAVLAELPDGVSQLSTAPGMAADLAETLRAAMVNDPLLGGAGTPSDPAMLLTPSAGKRARVSVISFVGLPAEEQRQGFVSQLQLEVFAWLKRNPAADRPLGGLIVMDEAQTIAPSGNLTASTQSTILLASQARKYGLGLILATQAPKGVHNQVVGNATTQFFGRLNSPAQIAAATDMARAKGSAVADISKLERGQFYATGESGGFRRIRAPLCLSHHPPSPLRLEEVLDRARPD